MYILELKKSIDSGFYSQCSSYFSRQVVFCCYSKKEQTMKKTVDKAIQNYKERLIRKAKRGGVWENFGQEEVGVLEDIYRNHQYITGDGVWSQIRTFDVWCQTYTGETK